MHRERLIVFAKAPRLGKVKTRLCPPLSAEQALGFHRALVEDTLERLALRTGGAYVRAVPGDFGVDRIMEQGLAGLKRAERESRLVRAYQDRYGWLIASALLLLFRETLVSERSPAGLRSKV